MELHEQIKDALDREPNLQRKATQLVADGLQRSVERLLDLPQDMPHRRDVESTCRYIESLREVLLGVIALTPVKPERPTFPT